MTMVAERDPYLFTVEEYMRLDIERRTELLGGVIYSVSPKNEPHSFAVNQLAIVLIRALDPAEVWVRTQDPIAVSGWTGKNAPEIDVAIIAAKKYQTTPTAADSRAFIEVSDTTYTADRKAKIPLLTGAGVPTWHVNIPARQVEFYGIDASAPRVFTLAESFDVLGVRIRVAQLFQDKE
jgi:hypothetical protein